MRIIEMNSPLSGGWLGEGVSQVRSLSGRCLHLFLFFMYFGHALRIKNVRRDDLRVVRLIQQNRRLVWAKLIEVGMFQVVVVTVVLPVLIAAEGEALPSCNPIQRLEGRRDLNDLVKLVVFVVRLLALSPQRGRICIWVLL